jgi:hypothetical protein
MITVGEAVGSGAVRGLAQRLPGASRGRVTLAPCAVVRRPARAEEPTGV